VGSDCPHRSAKSGGNPARISPLNKLSQLPCARSITRNVSGRMLSGTRALERMTNCRMALNSRARPAGALQYE